MLEQQAKTTWKQSAPPFRFEMLDGLVVFPDGYDEYRAIFGASASEPWPVPFYVGETRLAEAGGTKHLTHQTCIDVPWIPQRNGFICRRDPVTSLPREVSDEPSPKEWGVYYWMRPHGCRIVVMGIGVLDPMEVGGCALWWSPKESSPLLSVRATREATPELREAMNRALKDTYLRVAQRWTKCTETSPASDSIQT
jgi:predicted secreted protein